MSSGAGSSCATRWSSASGVSGGNALVGAGPASSTASTGAVATFLAEGADGEYGEHLVAVEPEESRTWKVLRYSPEAVNSGLDGSAAGVRQPPRPPEARGDASSGVTRTSGDDESES